MKKIITLLLAAGMFTVASAQSRSFDHDRQENSYTYHAKQSVISQIYRSYNFKIDAVKQSRWMSRWEKSKQVKQLENQRDAEISRVQFRFEKEDHGMKDHGYADNKRSRY